MHLEVRPGDDDGAARVVDALAEQVLAEAALLALEHVAERLQGAVAGAGDGAAAAAVVEQGVDGLLQHALLVVDDDVRRLQVEQPLEAVVAVDHAAIEVVQVAGGEAATVELDHRPQLGRDDRDDVEHHRLGLVAAREEGRGDLEPLDGACLALAFGSGDDLFQRRRLVLEVHQTQQLAHGLGACAAGEVHAHAVRFELRGPAEETLHLLIDRLVVDHVARCDALEEIPGLVDLTLHLGHSLGPAVCVVVGQLLDLLAHLVDLFRTQLRDLEGEPPVRLVDVVVVEEAEFVARLF